jgi:hypothetical protein
MLITYYVIRRKSRVLLVINWVSEFSKHITDVLQQACMCLRIPREGKLEKMHISAFPILLTSLTCKYTRMLVRKKITGCVQVTNSSYMNGAETYKVYSFWDFEVYHGNCYCNIKCFNRKLQLIIAKIKFRWNKSMFLKPFKLPQVLVVLLTSHFLLLRYTNPLPLSNGFMVMNHTVKDYR